MKKYLVLLLLFMPLLTSCNGGEDPVDDEVTYEYSNEWSQGLKLETNYENKSFIFDGISEATLISCADGDTATFSMDGQSFRIRFQGIDTPETSSKLDPWGKPASDYTCEALTNASVIVIQSNEDTAKMDSTGSRYLGYVWVDGSLLNLELVEHGYTKPTGTSALIYKDDFVAAGTNARLAGLRVWGELDPDYDYTEGELISLETLYTDYDDYRYTKFQIQGVVTAVYKHGAYIEDDGYGFYLYYGYNSVLGITTGNEILITNAIISYYNGSPQIINITKESTTVVSENNDLDVLTTDITSLSTVNLNKFVKLENLTYVSHSNSESGVDITFTDGNGNNVDVRIDGDSPVRDTDDYYIRDGAFFKDMTIDVMGVLTEYNGEYQILLTETENYTIK